MQIEEASPSAASPSAIAPHIIIIGCGFGGLFAAQRLAKAPARITVIDRTNHHLFQPLLYQVATAGLSAPAVAAPIRHVLAHQKNATVLMAEVIDIDTTMRTVMLEDGRTLTYDHLIVAAGATHSYFGHDEWQSTAPGLKTLADAFEIRRRILMAFEHAERATDEVERTAWLRFVVIGAGATGVEMAGTMAEIARHTLPDEFRRFDSRKAEIVLVEGGDRVLSAYTPDLSERAKTQLEQLGVTVRLNCRVTNIDDSGVTFDSADKTPERMTAHTVIWCAGVAASPLGKLLAAPLDRAGRVMVDADLTVPGRPDVQVIGDLAAISCNGKAVPGIAPAAKQMGRHAADNIVRKLRAQAAAPFRYRDYGMLATIGRHAAVAHIGPVKLSGYFAWLTWLFAHVYFLIGFRNRLVVLLDWGWSYWSFERFARVIVEGVQRDAKDKFNSDEVNAK